MGGNTTQLAKLICYMGEGLQYILFRFQYSTSTHQHTFSYIVRLDTGYIWLHNTACKANLLHGYRASIHFVLLL